jgi:hypothetical protein
MVLVSETFVPVHAPVPVNDNVAVKLPDVEAALGVKKARAGLGF